MADFNNSSILFFGSVQWDKLSFNTKNDKAFSVSGKTTHPYMKCDCLVNPRIQKSEIKEIILGGGQNMLRPERRFDAII
ncbi:MAG: HindVP family restriction endonuclease [Desulfococcaceae bacterium]|nr:HindVP family restriction endonuclease [Desulfococcaceae bacterium]